jgi:hypothetical protein
MTDASKSETPLRATFKIKLNGETVSIATVGQAYQFLTNLSSIEWIEFKSLHDDAISALQGAADNAMLTVQATSALSRAQCRRPPCCSGMGGTIRTTIRCSVRCYDGPRLSGQRRQPLSRPDLGEEAVDLAGEILRLRR